MALNGLYCADVPLSNYSLTLKLENLSPTLITNSFGGAIFHTKNNSNIELLLWPARCRLIPVLHAWRDVTWVQVPVL